MSDGANLLDIAALQELRTALVRFGDEAKAAMNAAGQEADRVTRHLEERRAHWEREERRREEVMRQALAVLRACEASGDRNGPPDCSRPFEVWRRASLAHAEAVGNLKMAKHQIEQVRRQREEYERRAKGLVDFFYAELPKASALLEHALVSLSSYAGGATIGPAANYTPLVSHDPGSPFSSTPRLEDVYAEHGLETTAEKAKEYEGARDREKGY